jgi:hypothetical protein
LSAYFVTSGINKETFFHSLLESLHRTLEDYEKSEKDLGYDYRERTNIGFFAAAAARKGCIVLEEFMCNKKRGHREISGRADLWIKTPRNRRYQLEAKRIELSATTKDFDKKVQDALKSAIGDIKKITKEYVEGKTVGVVFVIPRIAKGYDLQNLKEMLLDRKSLNADFSAVHFCKQEIFRQKDIKSLAQKIPCVALVGKWYKGEENNK